jgi:hypothetical protein
MSKLLKTIINGTAVYTVATEYEIENFDSIISLEEVELVDSTPELEAIVSRVEDTELGAMPSEPEAEEEA